MTGALTVAFWLRAADAVGRAEGEPACADFCGMPGFAAAGFADDFWGDGLPSLELEAALSFTDLTADLLLAATGAFAVRATGALAGDLAGSFFF